MGRWYSCNDSFVSLSTLHEVLSEKVYVLFFSRTNQRTVSVSKAVTSNGVKSHGCNGSEASKSTEIAVPQKPAHAKPNVEQSSRKDVLTISKVGKTPSSLQMKFNYVGNSSSKERPATVNGKVDVHKSQSTIMNGCVKDSVSMISEKDSSSISRIGFGKNRKVTSVHGEKGEESLLANGKIDGIHCVGISLVKPDLGEDTSRRSNVIIVRGTDCHKLENNGFKNEHGISRNKRKPLEGSCILLAEDDMSQEKVKEIKEVRLNCGSQSNLHFTNT